MIRSRALNTIRREASRIRLGSKKQRWGNGSTGTSPAGQALLAMPSTCTNSRYFSNNKDEVRKKKQSTAEAFDRFKKTLQSPDRIAKAGTSQIRENPWMQFPPERLEKETQRLIEELQSPDINHGLIQINPEEYSGVFRAWSNLAKRKGIWAARQADSLLRYLKLAAEKSTSTGGGSIIPCYTSVLEAYANSENEGGTTDAATSARALLIEHLLPKHGNEITAEMFNHCLMAWAKTGSQDAGNQAEALRSVMKTLDNCPPNATTIQTTMQAWFKSAHPKAPEKIVEILTQTIQEWQVQDRPNSVAPTLPMFHLAMSALSKSATGHHQREIRKTAEQVEAFLQLLLDNVDRWHLLPNLRTYLIVLGAWERVEKLEKTGRAAQHAENILMHMVGAADKDAAEKSKNKKAGTPFSENSVSYASVMTAWTHANQPQRAEDLYHKMVNRYRLTEYQILAPRIADAISALSAWANAGRPDRVLQMIEVMKEVASEAKYPECQLDIRVFNILLNALGKNREAKEALTMLRWLESPTSVTKSDRDKFTLIFPPKISKNLFTGEVSYNSVLSALSRESLADEAESLLDLMKRKGMRLNIIAYTSVIYSLSGTRYPNKVARAYRLLEEAVSINAPDVISLVAFMQVCAHAEQPERDLALDLAWHAFNALELEARNDRAYKSMAQVINNTVHNKAERLDLLQKLAKECCQAGYLSESALKEFEYRGESQADTVLAWLESDFYQRKWSRNVLPGHGPRKLQKKTKRRPR